MKNSTALISLFLLFTLSSCSEEEAVKPLVTAENTDNNMVFALDGVDLEPGPELNKDLLARKEALKLDYTLEIMADLAQMNEIGKEKLARYNIAPEQISANPDDPMFAVSALIIEELEVLYANGYELVEGPPTGNEPHAMSKLGQCAMDAAGLTGFVHLAQTGVSAAGLNASVVLGALGRFTVRGALGWLGAAWIAYEAGRCLRAGLYAWPEGHPNHGKPLDYYIDRLTATRENFVAAAGDTAISIINETNPFIQ